LHTKLIATVAAALALSGCAVKAPPPAAVDLQNEGIAKACTPSAVDLAAPTPATIALTNDGWCGLVTAEKDGQPFKYGLVKTRPEHGRVYIRPVNGQTRVEYAAHSGYAGSDRFAVALVPNAAGAPDTLLRVDVTVTPGEGQAAAPAAAPAPAPAKKPAAPAHAPARRHTTRR
jgi:hypothetical protein